MSVITVNPAKLKPPSRVVTFSEWLALFTADERAWAFASDHPVIREMIARGTASNAIDLATPAVAGFLDMCIALGAPIDAARKAEIIAGQAPA